MSLAVQENTGKIDTIWCKIECSDMITEITTINLNNLTKFDS